MAFAQSQCGDPAGPPPALIPHKGPRGGTLSSSKLRVKWRISANCLAKACSRSRCWVGAYGGLVRASSRLRRAFSGDEAPLVPLLLLCTSPAPAGETEARGSAASTLEHTPWPGLPPKPAPFLHQGRDARCNGGI